MNFEVFDSIIFDSGHGHGVAMIIAVDSAENKLEIVKYKEVAERHEHLYMADMARSGGSGSGEEGRAATLRASPLCGGVCCN